MQDYTYSTFSLAAIAIHLIINFNILTGRDVVTMSGTRYRGFLWGILCYYLIDAAWGLFAGLGWTRLLYVDTILFFLSLVAFVFMWCHFVIAYLDLSKLTERILYSCGFALLAYNIVLIVANIFNKCYFYIDEHGKYMLGPQRAPALAFLIGFHFLIMICVLMKGIASRDFLRRRSMMAFMVCITMILSIVLQIVLPLTPFTSLGCLVCTCFFHVFVISEEQAAKHMEELENALERAHKAEKAKSYFFSSVSHDIRTPLNSIIGFSEMLQLGIEDSEEKEKALGAIITSAHTLLELINDVLDLSKLEAGRMELHPVPTDVSSVVKNVTSAFEAATSQMSVQLKTKVEKMPFLKLDPQRIRQILFNLIGNAVKFTTKGSITVSASYADGAFTLSVADTGWGIAKENIEKLMSPYVQILEHDISKGSGLGLSICKQLSKQMNGTLELESTLGKGSTFTLRIPNVEAFSEKESEEYLNTHNVPQIKLQLDEAIAEKNILIVDDQKLNLRILQTMLSRLGINKVLTAENGKDALEAMRNSGNVDIVLTDMTMPVMDGAELVREIRKTPQFNRIPVYVITADVEMKEQAKEAGFDNMLIKPITLEKLKELLANYAPHKQTCTADGEGEKNA